LWIGPVLTLLVALAPLHALAQGPPLPPSDQLADEPVLMLGKAAVAEGVRNQVPVNEAIVFSVTLNKVFCFTDFFSVSDRTVIYHNWYRRDQRYASVKLSVRPPRWATYSSIRLADNLKGPWRIEVTDSGGKVLRTLRFSIIE
jgi:hypothetical protein